MAFPHSDYADHRVLRGNPRDWYDVYKDTFDYLYDAEPMGILHVAVHSHFGGRPLIAAQFAKILRYFAGFSDVWMPKHAELVDYLMAQGIGDLSYPTRFPA